jgi:hypothetical protein
MMVIWYSNSRDKFVFEFHRIGDKMGLYPDVIVSGVGRFFDRLLQTAGCRMNRILR